MNSETKLPIEVNLVPAIHKDLAVIYHWFAESDLTKEMVGPPHFPDHPIPTLEEFAEDYEPYFFDGSLPEKGRSYVIEYKGTKVGQINYQACEQTQNAAELDIWLASSIYTNSGIGTRAIELMCTELFEMHFELLLIAPSARNQRAIKAYKKAGFVETNDLQSDHPDYEDAVTLVRHKNDIYKYN